MSAPPLPTIWQALAAQFPRSTRRMPESLAASAGLICDVCETPIGYLEVYRVGEAGRLAHDDCLERDGWALPRLVCAWCQAVLRDGPTSAPPSHGICEACQRRVLAELEQEPPREPRLVDRDRGTADAETKTP